MRGVKYLLSLLFTFQTLSAVDLGCGEMHGFVSQGYLYSTNNQFFGKTNKGTFEFNEVGLNYSVSPIDKLRVGVQLFSRRLADIGKNKVQIDWAYGDYRFRDEIGLRAGKFKVPLGLHNQSRDADVARTWILLPQSLYDESYRDFVIGLWGVDVYGNVSAKCMGDFDYEVYIGSPDLDPHEPAIAEYHEKIRNNLGLSDVHKPKANSKYIYGASLIWNSPLDGLRLGGSVGKGILLFEYLFYNGMAAPHPTGKVKSSFDLVTWNFFFEYAYKCFTVSGEYSHFDAPITVNLHMTTVTPSVMTLNLPIYNEGYYLAVEYQACDCLTLGAYHSTFFYDRHDKSSSPGQYQKDIDLSARYDINEHWLVKLEFHLIKGNAQLLSADNPQGMDKHWNLFLAKTSYCF